MQGDKSALRAALEEVKDAVGTPGGVNDNVDFNIAPFFQEIPSMLDQIKEEHVEDEEIQDLRLRILTMLKKTSNQSTQERAQALRKVNFTNCARFFISNARVMMCKFENFSST